MINFLIWIIAGAVIGWVASIIMRTNRRQGLIADMLVGIVGAFLAGWFLSPLFGVGTINQGDFSLPALLVSLGGAVIVLAISKLFRNVGGFLFVIVLVFLVYLYLNCWVMEADSGLCTTLRGLTIFQ